MEATVVPLSSEWGLARRGGTLGKRGRPPASTFLPKNRSRPLLVQERMGWFHQDFPGHEGYAVAVVQVEGHPGYWRELSARYGDDQERTIETFQAACDCGWRSPRMSVRHPSIWYPFSVDLCAEDKDLVHRLWCKHLEETGPR